MFTIQLHDCEGVIPMQAGLKNGATQSGQTPIGAIRKQVCFPYSKHTFCATTKYSYFHLMFPRGCCVSFYSFLRAVFERALIKGGTFSNRGL